MTGRETGVSKIKLYSVAIAFTLSIGFSFYGIKICVPYADTLTILAYRYGVACIGVVIWRIAAGAMGVLPERKPGRPKKMLYMTAAFYLLFMIFQILAMFFATSIEGALVYAMVPIFASVIGRIALGEKATGLQTFFVVMTVCALLILIILNATDIHLNVTGLLIMTVSSLFMACQNVSARYVRGVFSPTEISETIAVGGTVIFVGASLVRAAAKGSIGWLLEPLHHPDFVIWVSFLGIFCILLSAQFMAYMLAHMELVQSTIFNSASTLVSIVAGVLLLGEPLEWYHYLCGILILAGVIGLSTAPAKAENEGKSLGDDISVK